MDEIVRRLKGINKDSIFSLKESKIEEKVLLEVEEDEEFADAPETGDPADDISLEDAPEESESEESSENDEEDLEPEAPAEPKTPKDTNPNPLDNVYAVNYKLGQEVSLVYADGSKSGISGIIEGYDKEGFYRIKWENGKTANGFTDLAISELLDIKSENKCVCGSTEFVNENNQVVCDHCGRIRESKVIESSDPLTLADKSRPKGKRLIRSEAHPISTSVNSNISESATEATPEQVVNAYKILANNYSFIDKVAGYNRLCAEYGVEFVQGILKGDSPKKSIEESIRKALSKKKLKEARSPYFDYLQMKLEGEFWTRIEEIKEDIEDLGYTVDDINSEYVVVYGEDEDGTEHTMLIPIGGTSRTMTLDFDRARML